MMYRVSWEIDVEADSPRDAATEASRIMQAPKRERDSAVVFDVAPWPQAKQNDFSGPWTRIDLEEP